MAKITRNKVVDENIFGEVIGQAEQMLGLLVSNSIAAQKLHAETMKLAKAFNGSAKAQRELIELDIKSEKLVQEKIKSDAQIQKVEAEAAKARKAQIQAQAALNKEKERAAKASEKEAKATKDASSEYTKQSKRLNELRKEYKDLLLTQGKETAQMKIMRKEIIALDATLKKVDATVGQHQRSVGNYERALGGVKNMLGQLGLAFGVFTILKDVFNITKDNEEAMASLAAITGLSGAEFDKFENKVNEVATELRVSSTEVAKAFELIASAQPALLKDADALADVTEQAIILNKAIKGDLAETSLALVGVMNQFGASAEEAADIINILAAGSQAGAATVNQINESMVKFGTTAKILNVSIEESVGLIETLGEKAIFGAEAGTALKNIMLIMSSIDVLPPKALAQLEKYGVDTDIVTDTTISFSERLKELSKIGQDTTAIMQVFGKENATAATVLLNSTETLDHMTAAVTGTSVAQEQAAVNSNTLANILIEGRAAWDNYVVGLMNGTDSLEVLKSTLKFVFENLGSIIKVVLISVKAWAAYRITLALWNKEGTGVIQNLIKMTAGLSANFKGVTSLSGAMKGLGVAMKSISLAGWASILVTLVPLVWDFAEALFGSEKGAKELTLAEQSLNNVTKKTSERLVEEEAELTRVFEALKNTKAGTDERQKALDQVNEKYGITLKNLSDEGAFVRQLDLAYNDLIATLERKILQEVTLEEQTALIKSRLKLQKELVNLEKEALSQSSELNKTFQDFNAQEGTPGIGRSPVETRILSIKDQIKEINDALAALNQQGAPVIGGEMLGFTESEGSSGSKGKKALTAEEIRLKKLEDLRREHVRMLLQFEDSLIKKGVDRELIDEMLHEERADLYREELAYINELGFTTRDEYEKTEHALLKHNEAQEKYHKTQMARIEEVKKETSSVYQTMAEIAADNAAKIAKKQEEAIESLRDSIVEASKYLEQYAENAIDSLDRQIDKIDEAVDASKSREDQLREEAEKRNLNADEAITLERDRQKALLAEKEAMERKKMEIESLLIMLRAFAASVENGQGNPVANIKSQVTDLINFSKNLPGFIDGTETTLDKAMKQNIPGSGNDKYMIKADGKERILNPSLSALIPSHVTNKELVQSYLFSKAGQRIQSSYENNVSSSSGKAVFYDNSDVVSAINTLPAKMPNSNGIFDSVLGAFVYLEKHGNQATKYIAPIRKRW